MTENRVSRDRFLLLEWMQHYESCLQELLAWYAQGKVKSRETFVQEWLKKLYSMYLLSRRKYILTPTLAGGLSEDDRP